MLVQRVLWDLSKHPNAFRRDNGILKFRDSWSEAAQNTKQEKLPNWYQPTSIANPSRKYRHIQFPMADEAEPRKKMDSFLIWEFSKIHMVRRKSTPTRLCTFSVQMSMQGIFFLHWFNDPIDVTGVSAVPCGVRIFHWILFSPLVWDPDDLYAEVKQVSGWSSRVLDNLGDV